MRPFYLVIILVLTAVYLIFELGFNARLLDIVGSLAEADEIDAIEKWGRIISGIALTLAVWGSFLFPAASGGIILRSVLLPVCVVVGLLCVAFAWEGERAIVDNLVETSTGEMRKTALQLRIVTAAALTGKLPIADLALGGPEARRPEAKAFLAMFPAFVWSYPDLQRRLDDLASHPSMAEALAGTPLLRPSPETAWETMFKPAIVGYWRQYETGSQAYATALASVPGRQATAWQQYRQQLAENGLNDQTAFGYRREIISALVKKGLSLPPQWQPNDQRGFYDAVAAAIEAEARARFVFDSRQVLGSPIEPHLSFQEFCRNPAVLDALRARLSLDRLPPDGCNLSYVDFLSFVYPSIKGDAEPLLQNALASPSEFANDARLAAIGRAAVASVVVPPIALSFSLLGAVAHIFKTVRFALCLLFIGTEAVVPTILALCVGAGLIAYPWQHPNEITSSTGFLKLEEAKKADPGRGELQAGAIRWVIQAQPYFYPVNERIRQRLLGGFPFAASVTDGEQWQATLLR